jgi:hypothetical protein
VNLCGETLLQSKNTYCSFASFTCPFRAQKMIWILFPGRCPGLILLALSACFPVFHSFFELIIGVYLVFARKGQLLSRKKNQGRLCIWHFLIKDYLMDFQGS